MIQSLPVRLMGAFVTVAIVAGVAILDVSRAIGQDGGTRTLYIVRHGFYDYKDESAPDVGKALVPLGVAQARLAASRLRSFPVEMTALYSSTMTRARQTAAVIAEDFPGLEVQQTRLLRECIPPTWREDIMAEYEPAEMEECATQLDEAFAEFFVPSPEGDRHDILVCHGNVTRYLVTKALKVDPMSWLGMSVGNCSLTIVRVDPDGSLKVLAVGDVGHLPPNMQTGLDAVDRVLAIPGE